MEIVQVIIAAITANTDYLQNFSFSELRWYSFFIVLICGSVTMFGDSMSLLASRISKTRYGVSIFLQGFFFFGSILALSLFSFLTQKYMFGNNFEYNQILVVYSLGFAPLIFNIFSIIPYVGQHIRTFCYVWSYVVLVLIFSKYLGVGIPNAVSTVFITWLLAQIVSKTFIGGFVRSTRNFTLKYDDRNKEETLQELAKDYAAVFSFTK